MDRFNLHGRNIATLIRELGIKRNLIIIVLAMYYFFTILSALFEGISMMLLVAVFTGGVGSLSDTVIPTALLNHLEELLDVKQMSTLVLTLLCLFGAALIIRIGLLVTDGFLSAILRRKIQESVFSRYLYGDWAHMRNFRVGDAVGTNTQESMIVTKYILSAVNAIYFLLGAIVMGGLALFVSTKVMLMLGIIACPLLLLIRQVVSLQARLSHRSAVLRNIFSGDIADRYNGLLQVQVDNNFEYHLSQGLDSQAELTRVEYKIGICQSVIGSFNLLLIFSSLIGFSLWLYFNQSSPIPEMGLIASVGLLGLRLAHSLNGVVTAVGNVYRLSGSVGPVLEAMSVPKIRQRVEISEPVVSIEIDSISYLYGESRVFSDIPLSVKRKEPCLLCGPSGKGKTTLANIIAGLYFAESGDVLYIGASGKRYSSRLHSAKVGFVTQDIYLFKGTLRENLTASRNCTDAEIWSVLDQVDATDFIQQLGGLDAVGAEAGRSLSGGQRRRLGVARVLLSGADILIFDEVTAGLDQSNQSAVIGLIERLAQRFVIILISHDTLSMTDQKVFSI